MQQFYKFITFFYWSVVVAAKLLQPHSNGKTRGC